MSRPETEDKLERVLNDALRGAPLRRAPSTLQARVVGELQRRAALPWWRRSFAQWPLAQRSVFVVICVGLIGSTLLGGFSAVVGTRSFTEIGALTLSWAQPALALMSSAGGLVALLLRVIPPLWLYAGMVVGAMLYVALFGLGAAVYRTLYLRPVMAGDRL
jgi:hypothetical protein